MRLPGVGELVSEGAGCDKVDGKEKDEALTSEDHHQGYYDTDGYYRSS